MSVNLQKLREIRETFNDRNDIDKYLPESVRQRQADMRDLLDELIKRREEEIQQAEI